MPPVCFARTWPCDPAQGGTMNSRSGEPIPCYGEAIPCFAAEQGILSKPLGLLREMTVRPAKTVKKPKSANFPVLFPVFRESGPHALSGAAAKDVDRIAGLGRWRARRYARERRSLSLRTRLS